MLEPSPVSVTPPRAQIDAMRCSPMRMNQRVTQMTQMTQMPVHCRPSSADSPHLARFRTPSRRAKNPQKFARTSLDALPTPT
ncbi:MAG: hypothetical protein KatS3mg105_0596 [Gemmatales bacterium]|nr:MAG: hypothetical protein KatS3mg105_0596 [Gemmatales bacterium]